MVVPLVVGLAMKDTTDLPVLERLKKISNASSDSELARKLGLSQQSVAKARNTGIVPSSWIPKAATAFNVCTDWLFFGRGPMRPEEDTKQVLLTELRRKTDEIIEKDSGIVMIPMVEARLSAGSGSFETSSVIGRDYAFRRDFIQRKGSLNDMVLMRVSGDSMEPDVCDNDVVLIDQSKKDILPGRMYAVGFEESIYLKRIDNLPGKIILKSANPAYPPVELDVRGDLAEQFRVIGRVLWCGREYK